MNAPPMNIALAKTKPRFTGPCGSLLVPNDDEVCRRLAMLIEGECENPGPAKAAQKYGFTRQRYYQILADFYEQGAEGLLLQKPGPKPITAAPIKSCAWSSAVASSTPIPAPKSSLKKSASSVMPSASAAWNESSLITACKKNSMPLIPPTRLSLFRLSALAKSSVPCRPILKAWSDRSVRCWPTRFPAIKSASGSCCQITCAWALGT